MFARNAVTRSGRGFRMRFPSTKLGRMVECESILEGDVALLLEFSPGVVFYRQQPTLIQYWNGDGMRDYYPDFEVVLLNGSRLHLEVKHSRKLANPTVAAKYRAIADHYLRTPIRFQIITELECRQEPLRSNLRWLNYLRAKGGNEPLPTSTQLLHRLGWRSIALATVMDALGEKATLRLLASGLLHCDLTCAISPETPITVIHGDGHATLLV